MYSKYFGFSDLPFTIAPDPRYLYLSAQHREALASLLYGINCNGGFVLLTGDVGTGKTTVCRCLLEQLPDSAEVAFILNPKYSITELLEAICDELKIPCQHSLSQIKGYIDALNAHLLDVHARGINTVLIIDEAQNLSLDVLEQIRLLTNLETSSQKLLQIILIGQPELLDKLARPELRQLNQRITARYHLNALSRTELGAYVSHRLAVGGSDAPLFTRAALWRLHRLTGGVPRMVNIICDRALLGAFVERRGKVGWGVLGRAAREVRGQQAVSAPRWRLALLSVALVGLLLGMVFWYPGGPGLLAGLLPTVPAEVQASAEASLAPVEPLAPQPEAELQYLDSDEMRIEEPVVAALPSEPPSSPGDWQWPEGTDLGATEPLAYQALFQLWGIEYNPSGAPVVCQFSRLHKLGCLLQPADLDELLKLNLPAVINLFNAGGQSFYATLIGVEPRAGLARLNIAGEVRTVELAELRSWMQQHQLVLWRMPPGYQAPLRPEARSALVPWLDAQMAWLQGRTPTTTRGEYYDQELQLQVLAFQHHYQLITDAVVGPQTLIQLSSLTDADIPQLTVTEPEGE
ncbi:AAA family ATPase [Pseudomonas sp. SA3-5]|uniref:AAA family ATPase n=1 Tax=Pseudomonas aestuarii TaxID=3018340 RepID=A0ABT4XFI3_9PSED|nr:AAA family ATPase [Pseudomonas aestuarii]MDA7086949.1 AAA family ATPase [Pseudomonas aestuarii]